MIQRGHILEYKSVKLFADFALLHMLQHSTSAEVKYVPRYGKLVAIARRL
ncbi:uncharacterized protein PHALS_00824 [Plasmopara halstedii]|uniref:Uncharacterized protein n=1 Tax=Plasmopara halstedii TaxID=4781 RepID=A0A0P1ASG3_PLAHL|nr:uncharacterized protein PHALS_00824 [Plasmopara halstedii]CEG44460.1 hypothetical protein PHALS_00824 [Plasmopara halstedii]|eukprot:XP_024580829.1 hypothetical protein PHALS_00824 [Plasmopara halstedii]